MATFLGDLLATFPRDHPSIHALLYREIDALTNPGNDDAAANATRNCSASCAGAWTPTTYAGNRTSASPTSGWATWCRRP